MFIRYQVTNQTEASERFPRSACDETACGFSSYFTARAYAIRQRWTHFEIQAYDAAEEVRIEELFRTRIGEAVGV